MLIFLKSFLFCKHACKRLFKRLSRVFALSLIRYSYQTIIYTCVDVVDVLFLCGLLELQEDKRHVKNIWNGCAWCNVLEWCKTYCIYKNVRACSINVVMVMLCKNAYNMRCWNNFQHNNKYMIVIWLKPWAVRCGGSCIGLIFNPESALTWIRSA